MSIVYLAYWGGKDSDLNVGVQRDGSEQCQITRFVLCWGGLSCLAY